MAVNETYRQANRLSLPVPVGKKAGDPVRVGGLNGVLQTDRAATTASPVNADGTTNPAYNYGGGNPDGYASVLLEGAHDFTVGFAVNNIGDPVYILADGSALTGTSAGNTEFGHALTTKAATSGPLTVRIKN